MGCNIDTQCAFNHNNQLEHDRLTLTHSKQLGNAQLGSKKVLGARKLMALACAKTYGGYSKPEMRANTRPKNKTRRASYLVGGGVMSIYWLMTFQPRNQRDFKAFSA